MIKFMKMVKRIIICILAIVLAIILVLIGINIFVKATTRNQIISQTEASQLSDVDCILVLGCSVTAEQEPSNMLEQRLNKGIALYNSQASHNILMSGDHVGDYYDEVTVMMNYAVANGVPSSDIFLDHYGLSTYESIYRARNIYGADKIIIVTQEYHLYRALYIADSLGIDAYGVVASEGGEESNGGYEDRDMREFFARIKDFFNGFIKPESTYKGESISLEGNGEISHIRKTGNEN